MRWSRSESEGVPAEERAPARRPVPEEDRPAITERRTWWYRLGRGGGARIPHHGAELALPCLASRVEGDWQGRAGANRLLASSSSTYLSNEPAESGNFSSSARC